MRPLRSFRRDRAAFTLTELAVVLGIVGVILGAIWAASSKVASNNKVAKAASQVQVILGGYKSVYANTRMPTTSGTDITSVGINAGVFPADMIISGNAYNPWGGTVTVRAHKGYNGVYISYWGLKRDACMNLAATLAQSSSDALMSYVGTTANPNPKSYPPIGTDTQMSPTDINGYCGASNNEVTFVYPLN